MLATTARKSDAQELGGILGCSEVPGQREYARAPPPKDIPIALLMAIQVPAGEITKLLQPGSAGSAIKKLEELASADGGIETEQIQGLLSAMIACWAAIATASWQGGSACRTWR